MNCYASSGGCGDGSIDGTYSNLQSIGVVSEQCVPYYSGVTKAGGPCPTKCTTSTASFRKYRCLRGSVRRFSSVSAIKHELYNNGPVNSQYAVYYDMFSYKSGIYRHVSGDLAGTHSVKVVGWGVQNGVNYWIVANSWGVAWGERGWFRIMMGQAGIDSNVWVCNPDLNSQ